MCKPNDHEITPEKWQEITAGTGLDKFPSLGEFTKAWYNREVKGIDDPRLPPPLTEEERIKIDQEARELFTEERLREMEAWADRMLEGVE